MTSQNISNSHYNVKSSKYSVEYYTPPEILQPVRGIFGAKPALDPASNAIANRFVQADHFLTKEDDATTLDWNDYLKEDSRYVWVNPPFGKDNIEKFVEKALNCHLPVVMLLPNNFETQYVQYAMARCNFMCLMGRRPNYIGPDGQYLKNPPVKGAFLLFFNCQNELIEQVEKCFNMRTPVIFDGLTSKTKKLWNHHKGITLINPMSV